MIIWFSEIPISHPVRDLHLVKMLIVFVITDYLKVGLYKRLMKKGEVGMGISSQAEISV